MKRFAIFISLHLFLFLIVIAYQAQAEEEWTIGKHDTLSYAKVNGEVTYGDSLNFFIQSRDNCKNIYSSFTFYTFEKPADIYQLVGKKIPIKINNQKLTAEVIQVIPFLMGFRVSFLLGTFPMKEYVYRLNDFYEKEKKYEISIIDGIDFKAARYFDVPVNNWKLDKLVPSILEANKLCKNINNLES